MTTTRVVCRNPDCGDSADRCQAPPALKCTGENEVGWMFKCLRCEREGRLSFRAVHKAEIGGTLGAGLGDRGFGTTGSKGPGRYRSGFSPGQ